MLDNNRITFYYKNSLYICNVKQMYVICKFSCVFF